MVPTALQKAAVMLVRLSSFNALMKVTLLVTSTMIVPAAMVEVADEAVVVVEFEVGAVVGAVVGAAVGALDAIQATATETAVVDADLALPEGQVAQYSLVVSELNSLISSFVPQPHVAVFRVPVEARLPHGDTVQHTAFWAAASAPENATAEDFTV